MTQTNSPETVVSTGSTTEVAARTPMAVRKRNGETEPVDLDKIVRAVERCAAGLLVRRAAHRGDPDDLRAVRRRHHRGAGPAVDPDRRGDSPPTSRSTPGSRPACWRRTSQKEVAGQQIASFSQSVRLGRLEGLIGDATADFVEANARKLDQAIDTRTTGVRVLRPAHWSTTATC